MRPQAARALGGAALIGATLVLVSISLSLVLAAETPAPTSSSATTTTAATSTTTTTTTSSPSSKHYGHHQHQQHQRTATQARQSPMSVAAGVLGAVGSLVPGLITNVAPLVVLLGLGALMMPALSMSALGLLREGRRSAQEPAVPNPLAAYNLAGLQLPFVGPQLHQQQQHQFARPMQSSPQDVYYFTKRSMPSSGSGSASSWLASQLSSPALVGGLQELVERVGRALDNADKRYGA